MKNNKNHNESIKFCCVLVQNCDEKQLKVSSIQAGTLPGADCMNSPQNMRTKEIFSKS